MYYSAGTYESFAHPEKPKDVDKKSAYIIGTGLAGHINGSRPERRLHGEGRGEIRDEKGSQQSCCRRNGSRMNG